MIMSISPVFYAVFFIGFAGELFFIINFHSCVTYNMCLCLCVYVCVCSCVSLVQFLLAIKLN